MEFTDQKLFRWKLRTANCSFLGFVIAALWCLAGPASARVVRILGQHELTASELETYSNKQRKTFHQVTAVAAHLTQP